MKNKKELPINPPINEESKCENCIFAGDPEYLCQARLCVHAISELHECYIKREVEVK